ncbi:hypothetical protein CEXT_141101 [Caerostris extrusa]|uniref:Uncharacterized protein n=1 Tax=Caerostris extrusa TaxID=172846 RepID=A0AAV4QIZ0_CAEEX|nr:hypothetical protein CEXT_141101 [Caerostris extrusa]
MIILIHILNTSAEQNIHPHPHPNSALTSSTSNLSLAMGGRRIGDRLKWEPTDLEKMRRIIIPKRRADNQKFNSAKVLLGGLKPKGK